MDYSARRINHYRPQELLISIPYYHFRDVMGSIDHCTAGRAEMEVPESLRRLISSQDLS